MNEIELARHGALVEDLSKAITLLERSRTPILNSQEGASRLSPFRHLVFHLDATLDTVEEAIRSLKEYQREVTEYEEPGMEWAEEEADASLF